MKTFKEFLKENRISSRTVALLPSTAYHGSHGKWDTNKKKASIQDILNTNKNEGGHKSTIQVAHVTPHTTWMDHNGNGPHKLRFIVGSGHGSYDKTFNTHHDQTGAKTGLHQIVNTLHIQDGKIVHKDNDLHLNDKAPTAVYK
jgi:hypothetical protein